MVQYSVENENKIKIVTRPSESLENFLTLFLLTQSLSFLFLDNGKSTLIM